MKEISVRVFDDLDYATTGARHEASATVSVGLDGVWRELDLTEGNEKYVREMLGQWMAAGSEPAEPPAPPGTKSRFGPNPEKAAYNERLRQWVRENGLKNSSGSGWAYETNTTQQDYIGEPLKRKYEQHLAERRAAAEASAGKGRD
jgi:hypothetical protein